MRGWEGKGGERRQEGKGGLEREEMEERGRVGREGSDSRKGRVS